MTPAKIVAGFTGMMSLLMVFAMTRGSEPKSSSVTAEAVASDERFDAAWIDTMKPLTLKKADMERVKAAATDPRPVATERILVEQPSTIPPVVMVEKHRHHERAAVSDVCVRHKLRKVTMGKKWRCRK